MRRSPFLLLALAFASTAWAGLEVGSRRLSRTWALPPGLKSRYGAMKLDVRVDESLALPVLKQTDARTLSLRASSRFLESEAASRAAAFAVLRKLFGGTLRKPLTNEFLLRMPKDSRSQRSPLERLAAYGSYVLVGETPPSDSAAALSWIIKFQRIEKIKTPLRAGQKVLIGLHQTGWVPVENVPPVDFGHSTLAIRTIGAGPEGDIIFNPGAKDSITGEEVPLPVGDAIDPKVRSMVRISNLWDWVQTQVDLRYMDVKFHVYGLSHEQVQALEILARKGDRLDYGPAQTSKNNCAHGVYDLANSLLPVGRQLMGYPLIPALPITTFMRMGGFLNVLGGAFHSYGSLSLRSLVDHKGPSPEVDYLKQDFGDRDRLRTYREYKVWEDRLVSRHLTDQS